MGRLNNTENAAFVVGFSPEAPRKTDESLIGNCLQTDKERRDRWLASLYLAKVNHLLWRQDKSMGSAVEETYAHDRPTVIDTGRDLQIPARVSWNQLI
jgi:hypothetical protein